MYVPVRSITGRNFNFLTVILFNDANLCVFAVGNNLPGWLETEGIIMFCFFFKKTCEKNAKKISAKKVLSLWVVSVVSMYLPYCLPSSIILLTILMKLLLVSIAV